MPQRLSDYLKKTYGEKIYRLSLTSGCSCPNRDGSIILSDGTKLTGGCTFCSEGGSGEFAAEMASIDVQIADAKSRISSKTGAKKFIAYFQSFTNTYGDVERLHKIYKETIERDDIAILSLGTRPDCLGNDVIDMLKDLNSIKPVWIELGLQTIHEKTAAAFHRGYSLHVFEDAYHRLKEIGITVIVHVILGLPGESREDMLETVNYLAALEPAIDGIKLQNLQILKNTLMCEDYNAYLHSLDENKEISPDKTFHIMDMEEYTDLISDCLAILPRETVVHRMTGDGPRKLLVSPLWSLDKKRVLNTLNQKCAHFFSD